LSMINKLKEECRNEQAKMSMLEQSMADFNRDLTLSQEIVENHRGVLNIIQYLESIYRNDKLDVQSFWEALASSSISPTTRCHLIQVFALPLLKKQYNRLLVQSLPNKVDELELEQKLFSHLIDVAREWLKTKVDYSKLIDWYIEWKDIFKDRLETSKRIRYFRRKLLDVMYLATISNQRDLNSFRYVPYQESACPEDASSDRRSGSIRDAKSVRDQDVSPINFKQLIEQTASEHGLLFRPVTGRTHDSKQIYKLENQTIYIDNKVIFLSKNGRWLPKTLNDVIDGFVVSGR
jgi:hypothetical protein